MIEIFSFSFRISEKYVERSVFQPELRQFATNDVTRPDPEWLAPNSARQNPVKSGQTGRHHFRI